MASGWLPRQPCCLVGLSGCLVGYLPLLAWLSGWVVDWLTWLAVGLFRWLFHFVGCLFGRAAGWLVGLLAFWPVASVGKLYQLVG